MAEYIDREKLLRDINHYHLSDGKFQHWVEVQQAADVAPVRHGRWIDKGEYAVCTECGGRSGTQYDGVEPIPLMTQFCPNCGANMESEE